MTDRIAEIEKRAQAAFDGPWESDDECQICAQNRVLAQIVFNPCPSTDYHADAGNAEFIAHAREDIPYLLQALAASEARVKELEDTTGFTKFIDDAVAETAADVRGYNSGLEAAAKIAEAEAGMCLAREVCSSDLAEAHDVAAHSARNIAVAIRAKQVAYRLKDRGDGELFSEDVW